LTTILIALTCPALAFAQGSAADYARSENFIKWTQDKVFRTSVTPHWSADGERFWYRVDTAKGEWEFIAVDAAKGVRQRAFDHARLAAALAKIGDQEVPAKALPIDVLALDPDGKFVRFNAFGKRYECSLPDNEVREAGKEEPDPTPPAKAKGKGKFKQNPQRRGPSSTSPDGKWTAVFKEHNLWLKENATGDETVLTKDGTERDGYGSAYWSPDSSRLVVLRTAKGDQRKVYLIESTPADHRFPKLHTLDYAKPGDKVPVVKPHLFQVDGFKEIPVADTLFKNPYEMTRFHWDTDSKEFVFLFNERGHQALRLIGINGSTGQARAMIDEKSDTFIDYAGKFFLEELPGTGELIWMSQRDGWNHLYLYDRASGTVKNQITKGEWLVRGVDRVDREKRQIWFRAGGIYADQDPYHVHYCRINFDGTGLVKLTAGDGTHTVRYSPDGGFLIDSYSRVDLAPITELRRTSDGSLVCTLETGDMSALVKAGWQVPERFVAKGRDGKTDIYGVIYRPSNFDPTKKYPVIEAIYAGPQGSFVPKDFRSFYRPQVMAELGFILVQIDGMGTSNRSKAFHDVCWKNLGDSGFPDRILWIKAAAKKYQFMDIGKVGIYGGSAGGQSALRALLAHGDFYYVAVADCGCHDNLIDKIWWNELWMGYPLGPHYTEQSNVTNADKLTGKLLLTVGELDKNVDPVSTMQVVHALIKAGKDFDLLVVPGAGHGIGESAYAARRRKDFFVRHLLGVTPPDRNAATAKSAPAPTTGEAP
jgi:dipeptidyl aminopeptidase/acylaminoacyl peptidase